MTIFSKPYSTTAAPADRDMMLAYAASSHSAAIYLLDSRAVAGALLVDPMLKVRVVVRPCVTMAPLPAGSVPTATPTVASITFNSSDTHLAPVMGGPMALGHVVLVASRRSVPDWAIKGYPLEQELLDAAGFDSTGMVNPTLFAVPLLCPFTYGRPLLDNWDLADSDVHEQLELDLGAPAKQWAECMALALVEEKWSSYLDVYQAAKARAQLPRFLGERFPDIETHICTTEPILSMLPITEGSHPVEFAAFLALLGGIVAPVPAVVPAPVVAPVAPSTGVPGVITVVTASDKADEAAMQLGQLRLMLISLVARFDIEADKLVGPSFPVPAYAYTQVLAEKSKEERSQGMKMLLDTANSLRDEDNKYNQLVLCSDFSDHDILVVLAFLTGSFSKTPTQDFKTTTSSFSILHFLPLGKERVAALRSERHAHEMERSLGEAEANRSKKRAHFADINIFVTFDQLKSMIANALSAWQALFVCDHVDWRPVLVVALLKLFDFLVEPKTSVWWNEHGKLMPAFPICVALKADKLCAGLVEAAEHFTNFNAAKENNVAALYLEAYNDPVRVFYSDLKDIRKYVAHEKPWDVIPPYLAAALEARKKPRVDVAAAAGTRSAAPAGVSPASSAGSAGSVSRRGGGSFASPASSDNKTKGCFVLLDASFPPLCPEVRAKYCEGFATVGKECLRAAGACRFEHRSYLRYEPATLKDAQLAYIEANLGKVRFNKASFLLWREFQSSKPHLFAEPSGGALAQSAAPAVTGGEL